jgi:hypothetical protein
MLSENLIYIAVLIQVGATAGYACDTWRGKIQPNRVTWFMWALAPFIAWVAELVGGVGFFLSLPVFMIAFEPVVILACSLANKEAYWRTSSFDYLCGLFSAIGLIIWYVTRNQDYAIVFSILADFFAAIPTVRKAYSHPESENGTYFWVYAAGMILAVFCIPQNNFTSMGFLVYSAIINLVIASVIYRKNLFRFFHKSEIL